MPGGQLSPCATNRQVGLLDSRNASPLIFGNQFQPQAHLPESPFSGSCGLINGVPTSAYSLPELSLPRRTHARRNSERA
jgi:hypothetical protein